MFILTILDKYVLKSTKLYACFVDFAKFYNTISHDLFFPKSVEKGIHGNFYFLLKNMYQNCKYAIKVQLEIDHKKSKNVKQYKWSRTKCISAIAELKEGCNMSPVNQHVFIRFA